MTIPLSADDRAVVLETLEEIRSEPPPGNSAGTGCVLALPGFLLLLVFPMVARLLDIGSGLATFALVLGLVMLIVGLVLWFTSGHSERRQAQAAVEAALRVLESEDEERPVVLRAATLLLCNAYATHGPSMSQTFDFAGSRERIGDLLAVVLAVEEVLVEEQAIYPVFTVEEPPEA